MLPRSSQTNIETGVTPAESIRHIQEYGPEASSENTKFPDIDKDGAGNKEEDQTKRTDYQSIEGGDNNSSAFTALLPKSEFDEILGELFVAGHKQLFGTQHEIRNSREETKHSTTALTKANTDKIQSLRKHHYQLQVVFHTTPKGEQYDMVL
ncbi:hypothetical protein [Fodinibius saliphilus]|uniref:hypothetical protein n=1 Tax=Fodinibius saliphilus TaxID=1920650 RepID=UPI00110945C2|nr:hypothetical protein [Fodinibius saliphilus]